MGQSSCLILWKTQGCREVILVLMKQRSKQVCHIILFLLCYIPYNSYSLCLTITILQHIFKQLYALLSSDYIYAYDSNNNSEQASTDPNVTPKQSIIRGASLVVYPKGHAEVSLYAPLNIVEEKRRETEQCSRGRQFSLNKKRYTFLKMWSPTSSPSLVEVSSLSALVYASCGGFSPLIHIPCSLSSFQSPLHFVF